MSEKSKDSVLLTNITSAVATIQSLSALAGQVEKAAEIVSRCLLSGSKLICCGNGGSASDASHFATEFVCRFNQDRRPFPAISLADFGSTLTAIGNDYAYEQVFARQTRAFGKKGDVLVAFTTSGNSRNVLLALEAAREIGMQSIAFLGKSGGFTKGVASVDLLVPSQITARVQEGHLVLYHSLCEMVDADLMSATA